MIILRMLQDFWLKSLDIFSFKKANVLATVFLFLFGITPFFNYNLLYSQVKPFVVVLDPGHGGNDSGNRGNGYIEKDIALKIVLKIGAELEKLPNVKVIYTRKTDVFIELIQRANIANTADADLFISVHCDAFTKPSAYGAGTFVLGLHANERNFQVAQKENAVIFYEDEYEKNYDGFDPNDPESVISLLLMQETYLDQSIEAANSIQRSFVTNLNRKDRTVKQAGFIVLKYTYMPSVLVETGFLTNPNEGAYLNSTKGQTQMASTIAKAIKNYINEVKANVESSVKILTESNKKPQKQDLIFKIQIAASKKKLDIQPYNFKGLNAITRDETDGLYRYYYETSTNYEGAQQFLKEAQSKGYKNAFIVAFLNGNKITMSEALRLIN